MGPWIGILQFFAVDIHHFFYIAYMKKYAYLLLLLGSFKFTLAQIPPIVSAVEKPFNFIPTQITHVPEQGFAYLTRIWTLNGYDFKLHYHNLQGKLLWNYTPTKEQTNYFHKVIIGSEYSELTYLFLFDRILSFNKKRSINITRFNKKGDAEELNFPIEEEMDNSEPIAAFANSTGFYFLIAQGHSMGYYTDAKKNTPTERKIILYFLDHHKKKLEKITTEILSPKNQFAQDLGLEFIDSDNENFYLASKEFNADNKTLTQTLYMMNLEGGIESTYSLPFAFDYTPVVVTSQKRVDGKYSQNQMGGSYQEGVALKTIYFESALSHLKLDLKNGYLYAYGAEYKNPGKSDKEENMIKTPTHLFVHQFDLEKETLKSSFKLKVPEPIMAATTRYGLIPGPVELNLNPIDSQSVAFSILCFSTMMVYNTNFEQAEVNERKALSGRLKDINNHYYAMQVGYEQFQAPFYYYKHLLPKALVEYYKTNEGIKKYPKTILAIYTGHSFITVYCNKKAIETRVFPLDKK